MMAGQDILQEKLSLAAFWDAPSTLLPSVLGQKENSERKHF
jgi:hypothetical protein